MHFFGVNSLNYSLVDMLSDVQVSLERETGKAVLNTRRVMTTWMHWLGDTVENTQMVDLEVPINVIFHFRNYTYREQRRKNELFYKEKACLLALKIIIVIKQKRKNIFLIVDLIENSVVAPEVSSLVGPEGGHSH
jgi:hypothetical protein